MTAIPLRNASHFLVLIFLLFAACGRSEDRSSGKPSDTGIDSSDMYASPQAGLPGYVPNPDKKKELLDELARIRKWHDNGPSGDDAATMIHAEYSLFRVLIVTARALDKDESYNSYIDDQVTQFERDDKLRSTQTGKIMNGMAGVYGMYSILAQMKFRGQEDKEAAIQDIHSSTTKKMRPDIQAIEAAAKIGESSYRLTKMIMEEIDVDHLYTESFTQIADQYKRGEELAETDEDRFLNGMFRTFEISQLWALFLDPTQRKTLAEINSELLTKSAGAENVGTQMALSVEYLYRISLHIANSTVILTL